MFLTTQQIATPDIYQLLVNGVVPRPIAWVSTLDKNGNSNLAPYSFFSVASVNPPVLTVTAVPSREKPAKDTLQNILDTKEAVVHIVTSEFAASMNESCADYPAGVSEIDALGLANCPSEMVAPPSISDTKVRYECKLNQVIEVDKNPGGGMLILLDVVGVFVDESVLNDKSIDAAKLDVLGKLGGNDYSDTEVKKVMPRPSL